MPQRRGNRLLRLTLVSTGLILPAATLIPFGSLWLWQHGYLWHWAGAAFLIALAVLGLEWWLLRRPLYAEQDLPGDKLSGDAQASRETLAWQKFWFYMVPT